MLETPTAWKSSVEGETGHEDVHDHGGNVTMRRGDSGVEAVEAGLSADRRETRARRASFHATIVVGALATLATTGISSSARPRQGTAGQPEATHDLSEAVRLAELERP